jgi:hypothetical protein
VPALAHKLARLIRPFHLASPRGLIASGL